HCRLEGLLVLLLGYQTNLERVPSIQAANTKDIQDYQQTVDETAIIQSQAGADIAVFKAELVEAQQARDQKLEYDRVARDIMHYETRDTYHESIQALERDIQLLQLEKENKQKAFESRKTNLSQLVNSLKDLQATVEQERSVVTEDQKRLMDMERGYISSDDEGDMGLSDDEGQHHDSAEQEEKADDHVTSRFKERNNEEDEDDHHRHHEEEDEEEGIVN
ncbi:THO complex subunit 7, partial [Choanephora cucurbitarum]